jgi:hypothetical protein
MPALPQNASGANDRGKKARIRLKPGERGLSVANAS